MKRVILFFHFIILLFSIGNSQNSESDSLIEEIAFHADVMVNADMEKHRLKAHGIFSKSIQTLLSQPGSYAISLDSIPWLSVLHGDDFRILTWQLRVSDEEYKYGGYIQWSDKLVELKDTRPWLNGSLRSTYTPGSWYGALYYKLIPFQSAAKTYYLLFGFNAENQLLNTKVADVLDLEGEQPRFGLPVFIGPEEPQTRLILTYADVSSVHLNYDTELNAIVHDHLTNLMGVGPGGEPLPVSDGSLEGWLFKNGKWSYQEKMYDVKMDEPPMSEERKERKEDKDILGRPRKP